MTTRRDYYKAKKNVRENKKSYVRQGIEIDVKASSVGQELERKQTAKLHTKQNKKDKRQQLLSKLKFKK